ncbi:MAG TPA: hypothetical protein VK009_17990 [Chloroflexota bacterium]|nr:hypothetical protein [Chloroflexota bacterium]
MPLPRGGDTLRVTPDGVIVYGDGQARGVLRVALTNLASLSEVEQDFACALFARLATVLTAGQTMQLVVESDPIAPAGVTGMMQRLITSPHEGLRALADRATRQLEAELGRKHVPDKSAYLLIGPPLERALGLAGALAGLRETVGMERHREPDLYGVDAALDDAASILAAIGIAAERLRGPAVRDLLWRCTNPGRPAPEALATVEDLVAVLPPASWHEHFDYVQVGDLLVRSLVIMDPPDVTDPGWLDDMVSLDARYRLSWHLRGRDRDRERGRQLRRRKTLHNLAVTTGHMTDLDSEGASLEAERLAEEMVDAGVGIVSSTLLLTLQAESLAALDTATRHAVRVIRTRYSTYGRGRGHQRALWRASLPYGVDVSGRGRRWHSSSIGNGLPYLAHSPGMPSGFPLGFTTRGGELVALDLSHPSLPNWVAVVLGRQGSGKTFVTQLFTLWTLYQGGRATIIDRAGHYRALIDLQGGTYVALGKDAHPPTINPWELRPGEDLRRKVDTLLALHEIMLTRPGQELDPRTEAALERAIKAVYEEHARCRAAGERPDQPQPLERDLLRYLAQEAHGPDLTDAERDVRRALIDTLQPYAGDGRYAPITDRPTTVDVETTLLCFDLDGLPERLYAITMFIIADAMAQRATNTYDRRTTAGQGDRHPELLVIDEGWFLARYAGAGVWLDDMARRSRHMGLRFVFTTQQLSDLIDNPKAVGIINAASMKCLFRQQDARSGAGVNTIDWLASQLHISPAEARQTTQLRNGQMMLFREGKDGSYRRGVVDVWASDHEYWLFTSEPERDVPAKLAALERQGGDVLAALDELVRQHQGR